MNSSLFSLSRTANIAGILLIGTVAVIAWAVGRAASLWNDDEDEL